MAGVQHTLRMAVSGGGLPIVAGGALVGAIGVGGGTVDQDVDCARAALDAIEKASGVSPG